MRRSVAATLLTTLIGACTVTVVVGISAGGCGFDGIGARDGSTLADVTTSGDGAGGGPLDGGDPDGGGDSSVVGLEGGATAYGLRVTSGLVALYEFEEDGGSIARDTVAAAGLDLVAADPTKIAWKPHALSFTEDTAIATQLPLGKVSTAVGVSNEVTVEVWVEPAPSNGNARTRIATMAQDNNNLDFVLGLDTSNSPWAAVQANTDLSPAVNLAPKLDHLVMTRTASDATLRLYLDGTQITGELGSTPNPSAAWMLVPLVVGNSSENNRPWRGTIHLLAIYSRALLPSEIATNHGAGADP